LLAACGGGGEPGIGSFASGGQGLADPVVIDSGTPATTEPTGSSAPVVLPKLDTTMPMQPQVSVITGALPSIQISGLEPMASWEYSLDEQRTWIRGSGLSLPVAGNYLPRIWTRQVDAAGNASPAIATLLETPATATGWIEASGNPLEPTVLPQWEGTLLLHGVVIRGDADFVRFDVPQGYLLRSMRLVAYDSIDTVAFYALQKSPVFDAGTDISRMVSWKHLGPPDLLAELLGSVAVAERGAGPYTLWIQQTGADRTAYAVDITISAQ
jgi:hypothetical protein